MITKGLGLSRIGKWKEEENHVVVDNESIHDTLVCKVIKDTDMDESSRLSQRKGVPHVWLH